MIGLDLTEVRTKVVCGFEIAARLDVVWDADCYSSGDSITLTGMNRLLDGFDSLGTATSGSTVQPPSPEQDESETDVVVAELTDIETRIAEAIVDLSKTERVPSGFRVDRASVEVGSDAFANGSWRTQLMEVVEWLHFDEDIDEASTETFAASLSIALGVGAESSIESAANSMGSLLPRLVERLDRAIQLRDAFLTEVEKIDEGSATIESATAVWEARWAEAEEEEDVEGSGPIHAEAGTWTISQFLGYAASGELNLSPSFQRADVWTTTMSQQLIESVLRGIPLPSVIILERLDVDNGMTTYEIVDGKQRLTSLLRFTGRHPVAVETVEKKAVEWGVEDLLTTFQTDYPAFKKIWKDKDPNRLTAALERSLYFPFPLRSGEVKPLSGALAPLRGKYYCHIRESKIPVLGVPRSVKYVFEEGVSKYLLPVIMYGTVTDEQIHEVFSLYNKQGKHLNAEEIRNARYHHLDLMKALVVTAGDAGTVGTDAAFLESEWDDLSSTQEVLNNYGFPQAGYKRTKLLSWVSAALLLGDDALPGRSTTNHINALLYRVAKYKTDRLRNPATILKAMMLLDKGLDAHAEVGREIWAKTFVNPRSTGKWQELQLVSTLIALSAAHVVRGDALVDDLESKFTDIKNASAKWSRPKKSQSKEQWEFIAMVVSEFLALLDVDPAAVDARLIEDFGASGLGRLVAVHTK
ncbi:DUF262 domain-containing protein [Nocardioides dongxiaopingii]|uniref:DUF262 domain-containing protein n=1 Tax=Nocardioides dongxiaopingii TaxID=2576036 RepID=UPI001484E5E8|nr:DUF262 domain-containing protein [Nocardioides dongxiaopingii]